MRAGATTLRRWTIAAVAFAWVAVGAGAAAAQGRQGGQGRGNATAQAAAPTDLTGYWVSYVTEDWRWRMVTPPKGDYTSVPLNDAGIKVTNAWDPAKDEAIGEQCKAYGAPAALRLPGQLRISWQDANTLKIETDAGTQTRLLHFGGTRPASAERTWQGYSTASWPAGGGGRGGARGAEQPQTLTVVTTGLRAGYLRKNGVPYSADAAVTEYFNRLEERDGASWLVVTTVVDDPTYLTQPFLVSTHFKKVSDGSGWTPTPCSAK